MNTYTIVSLTRVTDEYWRLHKAGCKDIAKDGHPDLRTDIEAANAREAAEAFIDEELAEMGYDASHIKIIACAR